MDCRHMKRHPYKQTYTVAGEERFHIIMRCLICHGNALGEGKWLSKRKLNWHEHLTEDPWKGEQPIDPRQEALDL